MVIAMINHNTADQYYNDFEFEIKQEKTSLLLPTINWSKLGIFSVLETVTWSEVVEVFSGFALIYLMIILAGIYS